MWYSECSKQKGHQYEERPYLLDTSIPKSLDVRYLTCSMDSKDFYIALLNSIREAENFGFTMNSLWYAFYRSIDFSIISSNFLKSLITPVNGSIMTSFKTNCINIWLLKLPS